MANKKPPTQQQRYILEFVASQKEVADESTDKSKRDIQEIGCTKFRIWDKVVRVIEWHERWKSVVVVIESGGGPDVPNETVSRYSYPLHGSYFPFITFEVLEDCGYLARFANGDEYVVEGKRYGVRDDVVWAGGKRYLSGKEKEGFGSFRDFLAKHNDFSTKKTII